MTIKEEGKRYEAWVYGYCAALTKFKKRLADEIATKQARFEKFPAQEFERGIIMGFNEAYVMTDAHLEKMHEEIDGFMEDE